MKLSVYFHGFVLAAVAGLSFVAGSSQAQIVFDNGGANVVNSALADYILVRDSAMGMPTTVLIQTGANVPNQGAPNTPSIIVEDSSIVEMSDGMTAGHFNTFDNSIGIFTGGVVADEVEAFGNSMITIGTPMGTATVLDIQDDLQVAENGFIEVYEGRVFDDIEVGGSSMLDIYGGEFDEDVEAFDNAVVNIFGGQFNTGVGDPDDIEGGKIQVEDDLSPNAATINVHGGTFVGALFDPDFTAESDGTINIFGSDFAVDGAPVPFGQLVATTGQLTGTLEDGSSLNNDFEQTGNGRIILVEAGCEFGLGDVNQDGVVSLLDVAPFVTIVTSGGFQCEADANEDGVVSLLDVAPFVTLVTGG